jgi:hypothetical protein
MAKLTTFSSVTGEIKMEFGQRFISWCKLNYA